MLVAVTDHASDRYRQRVAGRTGAVDPRTEIASRVSRAWTAGRHTTEPPPGASAARGSVYVHDLDDRALVFVCRRDGVELIVVTLWERTGGVAEPRVPKRFTDEVRGT